mmetsp:Transcript_20250/g.42364  ORF Transcript_20250/g.42364 Transcript_20250/m.42364 type:complete len:205 (+) Transcript_20250:159-773(+)
MSDPGHYHTVMTSFVSKACVSTFALLLLEWHSVSAVRNMTQPERPHHMQRKAKLHRNKALLESELIGKNIEFIKRSERSDLRVPGSNFRCNDEEEKTLTGYSCSKMDQAAFITNAELGSRAATDFTHECDDGKDSLGFDYINDIWGYESSSSNRKYAIAGMWDGTSFVDITDQRNPVVLGFLEMSVSTPFYVLRCLSSVARSHV